MVIICLFRIVKNEKGIAPSVSRWWHVRVKIVTRAGHLFDTSACLPVSPPLSTCPTGSFSHFPRQFVQVSGNLHNLKISSLAPCAKDEIHCCLEGIQNVLTGTVPESTPGEHVEGIQNVLIRTVPESTNKKRPLNPSLQRCNPARYLRNTLYLATNLNNFFELTKFSATFLL